MKINSFKVGTKRPKLIPVQKGVRGSVNARLVAEDVKSMVEKGGIISYRKIIKNRGYSNAMADNPTRITSQPSYREVMDPFVGQMIKERDMAIGSMGKVRKNASYRDLVDAIDKLTKNILLLTGKDTERKSDIREYMDMLNRLMAERMK